MTIVAVLIFTSSRTTISSDSRVGTSAANFTIGNDSVVVTLDQYKGKWVIVNVWSSADAMARIENIRLSKLAARHDGVEQLAVNFDRSKALFDEVVAADSISATHQFFCHHQDRTSFNNSWGTDGTACTFLINGKGVIVAVNPSEQEILAAIK